MSLSGADVGQDVIYKVGPSTHPSHARGISNSFTARQEYRIRCMEITHGLVTHLSLTGNSQSTLKELFRDLWKKCRSPLIGTLKCIRPNQTPS
jgi:hypothetical protein